LPGQVLVVLDNGDIFSGLNEARAALRIEKAKYSELLRGARTEELEVDEVKVTNAERALKVSEVSLLNSIRDAYTKADDVIHNKSDQFFDNPTSSNPQLKIYIIDKGLELKLENNRPKIESLLSDWNSDIAKLEIGQNLELLTSETKTNLSGIQSFVENIAQAVNSLTSNSSLSQTTIDSYKSDVSTARTNINTALVKVLSDDDTVSSKKSALLLAQKELDLLKAPPTEEELAKEEAAREEAEAHVANLEAQYEKTLIRSPLRGIISKLELSAGEFASAGSSIISVLSASRFEIETHIPEADIASVATGNLARITLDAYGNDVVFSGKVTEIEPAETIIDGVSTYKTTLQFDEEDTRVRSGMTANIDISAAAKEGVIAIPQRAVIRKDDKLFVRVLESGVMREALVEVGLRGSDGFIEITKGINEGDEVVVYLPQ